VSFGGTAATSFTVVSPTSITAVTPTRTAGQVDVQVTTAAGTSATSSADTLIFTTPVIPPAVFGLSSSTGSTVGGGSITITGANYQNVSNVVFGPVPATSYTVNSNSTITAVIPSESAGTVDVTVINSAGTSAISSSDSYTFQSLTPSITGLSTATGYTTGGT